MFWLLFAVGSAFFAGITAILAKIGIQSVPSHLATALRQAGCTGEILSVCHEPVTGAHVGPGMLALYFYSQTWR